MSKNKFQTFRDQIWKSSLTLSIIVGLSVSSFTMTGYFFMTQPVHFTDANEIDGQSKSILSSHIPQNSVISNDDKVLEYSTFDSKNTQFDNEVENIPLSDNTKSEIPVGVKPVEVLEHTHTILEQDMFANFKTECQNGIVNISWTTDGTDDESFKLEFSTDSINFSLMNRVPALAEVDKNQNLFKLSLPATEAETKYFRLRRDFPDNAFMYSQAVKVACNPNIEPEAAIDVFPAGNGSYRVVIDSKKNDHYRIVMTDMNEIELVVEEFDIQKGINQFTFKSGIMPRGNYNFKVTNGTNVVQKKVAIK